MNSLTINGHRIAHDIAGQGDVTAILETGIGAESAEWSPVASALADHMRVLTYDRAGRGASDLVSGVCTVADMQNDLFALIDATGLTAPFIVVGHSFGGGCWRARLPGNGASFYAVSCSSGRCILSSSIGSARPALSSRRRLR
ncbi:MAG: hypothetical protein CPDRYMAC_4863 [uncultured Paraburkholderia sp.]|nr:MAG: hypothetical protein CPDRYDRY_4792 [uncultured Paraburkholderia sp.]CAH2938606.1 MAG: hypothetical protein CPDRYMAC_4863 [uncultured Paraburkholderia sp.]